MSIGQSIRQHRADGRLHAIIPKAHGTAPKRAMFATEGLWDTLQASYQDEEFEERMGRLQADLETFATGDPIYPKYLFLLYPSRDGVWEIRSVTDAPSIRVLGLFAEKNIFIATHFVLREDLGGWQSRQWKEAKRTALANWRNLFPGYHPIITANIHEVVSGAIDGKYFKQ